jgi:hypothetical protein
MFTRLLSILLVFSLLPLTAAAQTRHPSASAISRAEFVRMTLDAVGTVTSGGTHCFPDVTVQHYAPAVCTAKARGIVRGFPDGTFLPDRPLLFVEAAAIVVRARETKTGSDPIWYMPYIRQLIQWKAVPASVWNILEPLTVSQAQELLRLAVDAREDRDRDEQTDEDRDMRLTVRASATRARIDDRVTFTVTIENLRGSELRLDARALLDDGLTFVSATRSGEAIRSEDVRWFDLRIPAYTSRELSLTVRVNDRALSGRTQRVRFEADGLRVTRTITVDEGDVARDVRLTVTDVDDPVRRLDTVTYRIRLENREASTIRIAVRAVLDDRMDFISASDDGRTDRDGEVRWDEVRLARDETRTLLLTVRASSRARAGDSLTLRVHAAGRSVTETTRVSEDSSMAEDVTIDLTASPDPARVGDIIRYRITVQNRASQTLSVAPRAFLDPTLSFLWASQDGQLRTGNEVRWDAFSLARDASRTLTLEARVRTTARDGDRPPMRVEVGTVVRTLRVRIAD